MGAVHHIALRTNDLPRLERFYVDVVGLSVAERRATGSVWLTAGPVLVMLEMRDSTEPEIAPGAMEMVAFAAGQGDGATIRSRLHAHGVEIEGETRNTLYFRDPDGRRVGLSAYPDPL